MNYSLSFFRLKSCKFTEKKVFQEFQKQPHWRCFKKKAVPKNFAIFTGKHVCIGVSFNKVAGLQVWRPVIKKRLLHMCFPVNIAKLLRRTILKNFCEWLLLDFCSLLLFEISRNSSECKNVYIKTLIFYHISNHTFLQYFLDIYKSFVEIQVQQVLPFFRKPFFSFFWMI